MIEKGRLRNPKNPELWLKSIRIEVDAGMLSSFVVYILYKCSAVVSETFYSLTRSFAALVFLFSSVSVPFWKFNIPLNHVRQLVG